MNILVANNLCTSLLGLCFLEVKLNSQHLYILKALNTFCHNDWAFSFNPTIQSS